MSEAPLVLERAASDRDRRYSLPLAPAGMVRLAPAIEMRAGQVLRLQHLESHNRSGRPNPAMLRELRAETVHHGALMPAGRVLGWIYDTETGETLAVSRPVAVRPRAVTEVAPVQPRETDLLLELKRPEPVTDLARYDVELSLDDTIATRPPDVVVPADDCLLVAWFDLPGSYATLQVRSPSVYLPAGQIALRPRKVEHVVADLRPLPALEVLLELPQALRFGQLALTVERIPSNEPLRQVELASTTVSRRLPAMPPAELLLVVESPPWRFRERVDLSDGRDGTVVFAPEPIILSGTVYYGEEARPASVSLYVDLSADRQLETETDEDGRFEAVLFRPGTYIAEVRLANTGGPPLMEILEIPDHPSFEHDFHISASVVRVRVVDAGTGESIGGARVVFSNEFDGQKAGQTAETDAEGWADLAHLRHGKLEVVANAEGYVAGEAKLVDIGEEQTERELTLPLQPIGKTTAFRLRLPSGAPAAGAEVLVQASLVDGKPAWGGQADEEGRIEIPRSHAGSMLLARHPLAASSLRPFREPAESEQSWRLPAAAPQPLSIVARTSWSDPAPWSQLMLWLGGYRVSGYALRWLTYSSLDSANHNGFWKGSNLPQSSLWLLAWAPSQRAQALAGALDSLASEIRYPWSYEIEIRAVE